MAAAALPCSPSLHKSNTRKRATLNLVHQESISSLSSTCSRQGPVGERTEKTSRISNFTESSWTKDGKRFSNKQRTFYWYRFSLNKSNNRRFQRYTVATDLGRDRMEFFRCLNEEWGRGKERRRRMANVSALYMPAPGPHRFKNQQAWTKQNSVQGLTHRVPARG